MHFFLATIHVAPLNLMTKLTISFQYIFIKISTQMLFGSKSQRAFVFGAKIPYSPIADANVMRWETYISRYP